MLVVVGVGVVVEAGVGDVVLLDEEEEEEEEGVGGTKYSS